ncbi:hypothetical protein QVD17_16138 [Tagetes erecta]|uniref:Uncharacterized protein n=1 Tax=Tagetes erecta TaxID=13708 RepID=A0AAD8KW84_TARER|nr:hypothetical protein QVD17_16138 [Tagetes erecta]
MRSDLQTQEPSASKMTDPGSFSQALGGPPNEDREYDQSFNDQPPAPPTLTAARTFEDSQTSSSREKDTSGDYYYASRDPWSTGDVREIHHSDVSGRDVVVANGPPDKMSQEDVRKIPKSDVSSEGDRNATGSGSAKPQSLGDIRLPLKSQDAPKSNFRMIIPNAFKRDDNDDDED